MRRSVGLVIFLLVTLHSNAQQELIIQLDGAVTDTILVFNELDTQRKVDLLINQKWLEGYLFFGLDSIYASNAYFHLGQKVSAEDLQLVYNDQEKQQFLNSRNIDLSHVKQQLTYYNNKGYPFASVNWDSIAVTDQKEYQVYFSIERGPEITNDSITFLSIVNIDKGYLASILNIDDGEAFSEANFQQLDSRLERLPFLQINQPQQIAFERGKAYYFLDLEQTATNSFEGVVGLLPGQSADQDLLFTGYIDLRLHNLFQSGKAFEFNWNRFANQSQELSLNYRHPYLLKSRLFLQTNFELLKQDTTFLTQSWQIAAGTNLGKVSEVSFTFQSQNGSMITPDAELLRDAIGDFQFRGYSASFSHVSYDLPFRFSRDFRYSLSASIGNKTIHKNPSIKEEAYDSLQLKTVSVNLVSGLRYQMKVTKYTTVYHDLRGYLLLNEQLLLNEMHRIGGLRTLRGFNERFFFAQHSFTSRLELRQYFEQASYVLAFYDAGQMKIQSGEWITAHGFGAGINLDAKAGLFTFVLGLGTTKDIPLDPANIKIHFGYTSKF